MTWVRNGFVRIPSSLFDQLLTMRWSATEMRVVLWVIRKTFGWNRHVTEFTWYKIAADLHLDRSGVLRAGKRLLAGEVLRVASGTIGLKDAETHLVLGPG